MPNPSQTNVIKRAIQKGSGKTLIACMNPAISLNNVPVIQEIKTFNRTPVSWEEN